MSSDDIESPAIEEAPKVHEASVATDAQKNVEFYAASVTAWYASALEHDKSIFALAAGAIALLVTLLTTVGFEELASLVLFAIAILSFLVTIASLLQVFRKNQDYIQQMLVSGRVENHPTLKLLDRTAQISFGVGVLFAAAVGFNVAITSFHKKQAEKEHAMATENKSTQTQRAHAFDSVNGAASLQPRTKSFQGAANLQPAASAPAPVPTVAAPSSAASAQATTAPASSPKSAP